MLKVHSARSGKMRGNVVSRYGPAANFNSANRSAMRRSELLSWPVTLTILAVAFGSLVAAGLPLMLTMGVGQAGRTSTAPTCRLPRRTIR